MEGIPAKKHERRERTPHQQYALERLRSFDGGVVACEVSPGEASKKEFLRAVADTGLPVEVSLVEGVNGLARIQTGIEDSRGVAAAGDKVIEHRHAVGRFSIHTHLEHTPEDITPSPGDAEILCRERSAHVATPAVIMNRYGLSLTGVNPFAREIDAAIRERHTHTGDDALDYLVEQGGWQNHQLINAYKMNLERWSHMDADIDTKIKAALSLAVDLGIVLAHKRWEDVTEEDLALAFDTRAAEAYWRNQTDDMLKRINAGEVTAEDLRDTLFSIRDKSLWNRVDPTHDQEDARTYMSESHPDRE